MRNTTHHTEITSTKMTAFAQSARVCLYLLAIVPFASGQSSCPLPSNARTLIVGDKLTMKEVVNPQDKTITVQLTFQGEAWLGFGISPEGGMVGADSIIGVPDTNSVLQHDMTGQRQSGVTPWESQTLTDASVVQENGATVLSFTMPLVNEGQNAIVPDGPNTFLYAYGRSNELAFHSQARAFTIDTPLQVCDPTTGTTPDYDESTSGVTGSGPWMFSITSITCMLAGVLSLAVNELLPVL